MEGKECIETKSKQVLRCLVAIRTSNSSTSGLLEIQDSVIDNESDSESEIDSDFDASLVEKRRKVDDCQFDKKGKSLLIGKNE